MDRGGFALGVGSVAGALHTAMGRPNQDACWWRRTEDTLCLCVCDGCGSGAHSEVGAQLGARLAVEAVLAQVAGRCPDEGQAVLDHDVVAVALAAAREAVLVSLRSLAAALGPDLGATAETFFLFTLVGAVVTPHTTAVFSVGDGTIALNGALTRLGPFLQNAPPYLGHSLLDPCIAVMQAPNAVALHHVAPTEEVRSILLATDGADALERHAATPLPGTDEPLGPLARFWEDPRYVDHPDLLRRWLARANRRTSTSRGLLGDDTTVAVIRRRDPEEDADA